jgi:hypothetical protein
MVAVFALLVALVFEIIGELIGLPRGKGYCLSLLGDCPADRKRAVKAARFAAHRVAAWR